MKKIIIPNTNFECSRLIFGTGSLLNIFDKKKRLELLESAVDLGFTHFDTSPYYGFGLAEENLGEIFKKNKNLTITTKVCLYPPNKLNHNFLEMVFRKSAGKIISKLSKPNIDFSINFAKQSIDNSLKKMKIDNIDILLIHEPIISLINVDEWKNFFENLVKIGKIKYFGISSLNSMRIKNFLNTEKKLFNIIQTLDSIDLQEANFISDNNLPFQITHGYISSLKKRQPKILLKNVFKDIINRNPKGAIIFSTTRKKNLYEITNLFKVNDQ
jgi:D-threo-aldose 1-dehydrogenase